METNWNTEALEFIEEVTKNAGQVQKMVLADILKQNAETEYLQRFNLDGATDTKTFTSKVPCITYEDIRPEIQRMENGDRSAILTALPVSEFLLSSGTTTSGKRKLIPMPEEEWNRRQVLSSLQMPVMNTYVPDLNKGKGLYFYFSWPETRTPGGHMTLTALAKYYRSEHYKNQRRDPYTQYTSPYESVLCTDYVQSMYVQLLCGLYQRKQINRVGASLASALLRVIKFFELNWQDLVHDIRVGSLNPKITYEPLRECMARIMKSDPELADFLTSECSGENWEGIIQRIWPNAKYLETLITGSMIQYATSLDYYSGGLPISTAKYASSECCFGINLNPISKPEDVSFTFMPNLAYFEFIPQEHHSSKMDIGNSTVTTPDLIDLVDVEVGKDYEVVITTYAGLYRYQMGDILRVTGFHNSAPKFKFLRRKGVLLSIEGDKTDEVELQMAMDNASQILQAYNVSLVDYTSHASKKIAPGHYVIYWELSVKDSDKNVQSDEAISRCCQTIENSFSLIYKQYRVHGAIAPLEIRVLKNGTFQDLVEFAVSRGASIGQYKVPRCVETGPVLEFLDSRVISSHFSPCLPSLASEESEE
ncbi:probable indole-3-acetic acid-amido synthetase GH3.1 [Coffea eugenioides]|uniref:probable indole-3-acetic acid-amido synthetase GH3.1 n=1 Tax=Coffea eugenioides TaxID=49369 RepID=UPI000F610158|nr:probable indole-3-acetic acid-amido synthetase GH3.1 [Coffea eugenioides]XP_027155492.1 probable indole-3-acetic acid-amido synthetase GH3.1 [Coffea eugenioides]XP_027156085.1 probable indole-3-acetic acid-amido synthetase GH3.1 [Coffea eugenioides]